MSEHVLKIACGPRNDRGNRLVVATFNGFQHRDTMDENNEWRRRSFRDSCISKFGLGDDAHEFIEAEIFAKASAVDSAPEQSERLIVKPASEYESQAVDWVWPGYLPAAAVSLFDGDPGLGKSQFTCWLAGAFTSTRTMPDGCLMPANVARDVVMLSAEDDRRRVIRPRLEAVGADVTRVHFVEGVAGLDDAERGFVLPRDVVRLEECVRSVNAGLVTIDPFAAYMDSQLSMNNDAHVRQAIKPLSEMAERTGAAVVMLRHLNKKDGAASMYRGGGSIGIIGASRAAYVIAKAQDDPALRILAPVKMNLAEMPKAQTFTVEPFGSTSRIVWAGESGLTADEILTTNKSSTSSTKTDEAKAIIQDVLAGGPRGSSEVESACLDAGIGKSTYWKARKELGVVCEKVDFGDGWMVSLPASTDPQPWPEFE